MVPLRATKAGARLEKQGARSPLPSDKLVSEVRGFEYGGRKWYIQWQRIALTATTIEAIEAHFQAVEGRLEDVEAAASKAIALTGRSWAEDTDAEELCEALDGEYKHL